MHAARRACLPMTSIAVIAIATAVVAAPPADDTGDHLVIREDPALTLTELVRLTAAHEGGAPVVAALREQAGELDRAARHPFPAAPAIALGIASDGIGGSGDGYRMGRAGVELPVWWPRQRRGRRALADAAQRSAAVAAEAHLLEVAGWLRAALAELALAEVHLDVARRDWQRAQELEAAVARAVELGELAQRDLLLIQSESLDSRFALREAVEEHRHAADSYHLLTGLERRPRDWSEPEADREGFADHPALARAAARAAGAHAELERLVRERWGQPLLTAGSEHERDRSDLPFSDRFVFGIRIPLGWSADATVAIAAARVAASEADRDRTRLERDLRQQLAESEHRLVLAKSRVRIATEQAHVSSEHFRLVQRAFELGEVDLTTLLRARARARSAERQQREAAILEQFQIAEFHQALGIVP